MIAVARRRAVLALVAVAALAGCARHVLRGADPAVGVVLPRDRGAHADAQTEWWHFHGHLTDEDGRKRDFFLAFVRQHTDLDRVAGLPLRWFVDPFDAAYFNLVERDGGAFRVRDRYAWPDVWAADADDHGLGLRHDDWLAETLDGGGDRMRLRATAHGARLDLTLTSTTPPVLMGRGGYVSFPPASSHYWEALPRMTAEGTLLLDGRERRVKGTAWYKHEWGFLYDARIRGWVYLGTQLSTGQELEIALLLDLDWQIVDGSFAAVIEPDGRVAPLDLRRIDLRESGETWRSPRFNDTVYPTGWTIDVPERQAFLVLRAVAADQEMVVVPANLWAGSLAATGTFDGREVTGDTFSELGGFHQPFGRALFRSGKPRGR